ncbi:Oxysterol-binding protein [Macleaya cordata]|uniref:Oxysterol-binding protein n=1 Tax=Macleaya cordata TaxID=56857 RepID=A0A200R923_MACCD|nr:Oxysterol-binding protein [Macleaya cordata]
MVRDDRGDQTKLAVLIPPLSLDSGSSSSADDDDDYKLPVFFNLPKSRLQTLGESVYCISGADDRILSRCNDGKTPLDRFTAVVAWGISTMARTVHSNVAPFNPILGETHHVSRGTLNVLLEQISSSHSLSVAVGVGFFFYLGASAEGIALGARQLKLLNHGENYVMNTPRFILRFFPVPKSDWTGNVTIRCEESGLEAELCFGGYSFLGLGGKYRSVKGRIFESSTSKTIYKVEGHWDRVVTIRDVVDKEKITTIYNGREALSKLKTPQVMDQKGLWTSESAVVWSEVSQSILNKDWEKAGEAKKAIEERQRELERERKSKGETWVPKHFKLSTSNKSMDGGYECSPKHKLVPPAPIVVPF